MCTFVDKDATKVYKKALKSKGGKGYAWKMVEVDEDGEYRAPFYLTYYSKCNCNVATGKAAYDYGVIQEGAFHCCTTRKVARFIKKYKITRRWASRLKIIKVVFDVKDVVAVGANHPADVMDWNLNPGENNVVCVRKFKFAEK